MKIVFLVSQLRSGGAERTVSYLSQYLANQEFLDVTILSVADDIFYKIDPKVKLVSLGIESNHRNIIERIIHVIQRQLAVRKYLNDNCPDVVFCMLAITTRFLMKGSKKKGYKLITSERNNPAMTRVPKEVAVRNRAFAMSDGIVFQTQRAKDFYPKEFQDKGVVIYNAMGNELVYKVPANVERKKKISAIGRLSEQKDYPTLFKAFAKVLDKHPEYCLEIFGEGPDRQKLQNMIQGLELQDKILLKGAHTDAILQAADSACYVMSSLYEGMPNALMEAMGAGIPCVSTDCPNGPAELIVDGENGLLVPVGDADALATAILRMIEDSDLAEKCSKNAKAILETNSVDVIAKQYMDFIIDICAKE